MKKYLILFIAVGILLNLYATETNTLKGTQVWPVLGSMPSTYDNNKVAADLRPDGVNSNFYIWEGTYIANSTESDNFYGGTGGYASLKVQESTTWSGAGVYLEKGSNQMTACRNLRQAILADPDQYFLHMAVRSTDNASHTFYFMNDKATSIVLGTPWEGGTSIGNFSRDGQWHEFDIPMKDFVSILDTIKLTEGANIFVILSGGTAGVSIDVDAVYFYTTAEIGEDPGYSLVWNADFATSSLQNNWNIEENGDGGGNNELQYYCSRGVRLGTDPVENKHCLILTATKENYQSKSCTSGRVNTKGQTYFTYGKIEARIWFPNTANGLWPAFWMMGNDIDDEGWPKCGETDIVELGSSGGFSGIQDRYFNGASHWGPTSDQHYQSATSITNDYSVVDGFHVFTCIWTPDKVAMYVDRHLYPNAVPYYELAITQSTDPNNQGAYFHKPNFVLLNLAVGGNFTGLSNINDITALANGSRSMYIDWVRVYQKGDNGQTFYSSVSSDPIEQTATDMRTVKVPNTDKPVKCLINGNIYIYYNNSYYNLLGHPME